jgi:hypothetical protein
MDKFWFYAQGANRQGPVPENEIKSLIASGQLSANDLAWTDGMANWLKIGSISELYPRAPVAPPTPPAPSSPSVSAVAAHTHVHRGLPEGLLNWMGFVGVINIITGILSCLTCVGILTGAFLVAAGASLMGARTALVSVNAVPAELAPFFEKFRSFLLMTGIVFIVGLVVWTGVMVLFMMGAATGGLNN